MRGEIGNAVGLETTTAHNFMGLINCNMFKRIRNNFVLLNVFFFICLIFCKLKKTKTLYFKFLELIISNLVSKRRIKPQSPSQSISCGNWGNKKRLFNAI